MEAKRQANMFQRLLAKVEVKDWQSTGQGEKPIEQDECTWGYFDFMAVMMWPAFNIATWTSGATLLALGLTVGQALGAAAVAYTVIVVSNIIAGLAGTRQRLSDPLFCRLAWGVKGYFVTLVLQLVVGTCYYGIQLVYGYLSLKPVIVALAPSFLTMKNTFSTTLPTNDFICLVIFLLISLVLQAFPPTSWHLVGKIGAALTLVTFSAIVGVCCGKAGGVGPLLRQPYDLLGIEAKPSTSRVTWAFFLAVSTVLALNWLLLIPNYTRFAKRPASPVPAIILGCGMLPLLTTTFGILAASAAVELFPQEERLLGAPYDILLAFQRDGSASARAAGFFGGLVLIIPQLGMNVIGNAYNTGISYATLFPRWFTIRRGGYLTAVVAVAINPWEFAGRPSSFGSYLNGVSMIYGSLAGLFLVDYFIIRKQHVDFPHLLLHDKTSIYFYWRGINLRTGAAFILAVWVFVPGWIAVIKEDGTSLDSSWKKLYALAWPLSVVLAGSIYYLLCKIWPLQVRVDRDGEEYKEDKNNHNGRDQIVEKTGESVA